MRDQEIFVRIQGLTQNVSMIYRQMIFIDARLQAFEAVLSQRWSPLLALFSPRSILRRVNKLHLEIMKKHDDELRAAAENQKSKPHLTIVPANGVAR